MHNPEITIVDSTPEHIRLMAECMHARIAETALKLGVSPKKALWHSYKQSITCKTAFINDSIAAIWGLGGNLYGEIGQPWLVLAPTADDHPFRVAFIYRKELKKMHEIFPILEDYVDESHAKAVRMLELMGFTFDEAVIERGNVRLRRAERSA